MQLAIWDLSILSWATHFPKHPNHQTPGDCGFTQPRFAFMSPYPDKTTIDNSGQGFVKLLIMETFFGLTVRNQFENILGVMKIQYFFLHAVMM